MNDSYTLAVRPLAVEGLPPTQLLTLFVAQFKTPGGRAFFDFLVTPEGQKAITEPNSANEARAREAGLKCALVLSQQHSCNGIFCLASDRVHSETTKHASLYNRSIIACKDCTDISWRCFLYPACAAYRRVTER
jgi:hypothetical protein